MSLYFSTESLRKLLSLSEQRDAILEQLNSLEAYISSALTGSEKIAAPAKAGRPAAAKSNKASKAGRKHGAVKELILSALKEAGNAGIGVKELSQKLGLKNASVHVWFGTTGKAMREIEKTGKGFYRFVTGAPTEAIKPEAPVKTKAKAKAKAKAKVKSVKKIAAPKVAKPKAPTKKAPKAKKAKKSKKVAKAEAPV